MLWWSRVEWAILCGVVCGGLCYGGVGNSKLCLALAVTVYI